MKLINLTPHPISVLGQQGEQIVTIQSSGEARLAVSRVIAGRISVPVWYGSEEDAVYIEHNTPVFASSFGELTGLPEQPEPHTAYIVSPLVAEYATGEPSLARWPLLVPDLIVRNSAGEIIGCQGFAVVSLAQARTWGILENRYGSDSWYTAIGPESGKLFHGVPRR